MRRNVIKPIAAFCLLLMAIFPAAPAWGSESADAQINPESNPDGTPPGFIIEDAGFFAMSDTFFQADFTEAMKSVALTDTWTVMFDPVPTDRLFPYVFITLTGADPFEADSAAIAAMVRSIIEAMLFLQRKFPDTSLFNNAMAQALTMTGLGYMVAEPNIWLWPESLSAVMIPLCFFDKKSGEIVDGIYLLEITAVDEGDIRYYAMYNNPRHVEDYLLHVRINPDGSPFQHALVYWHLRRFLSAWEDHVMGTVRVTGAKSDVMDSNRADANPVAIASRGEEYPALSRTDNGWYMIRHAEDVFGYISSKEVDFFAKEAE